jgi:hypothetical protein
MLPIDEPWGEIELSPEAWPGLDYAERISCSMTIATGCNRRPSWQGGLRRHETWRGLPVTGGSC